MYGVILQVIRLLLDQGRIVWVCLAVGLSCLVLGCFLALSRLLKHKPFKLCVGGLNMVGCVADITLFFGWIPGAKVVLSLVSTVASRGNDHHWVFFRHCILSGCPYCTFAPLHIRSQDYSSPCTDCPHFYYHPFANSQSDLSSYNTSRLVRYNYSTKSPFPLNFPLVLY